jgi:5-(carboxyamino)imidazole ribonucleotide mutase
MYPLTMTVSNNPLVGVVMGSSSDWETLEATATTLTALGIPYEAKVVSAHRTPHLLVSYSGDAAARGLKVVIAGAGGAAHLPGMVASMTHLPVIGVPVESKALHGMDSLLSIVQMPAGIPVATVAIGKAGATNAALLAASILGLSDAAISKALQSFRAKQTDDVLKSSLPPPTKS